MNCAALRSRGGEREVEEKTAVLFVSVRGSVGPVGGAGWVAWAGACAAGGGGGGGGWVGLGRWGGCFPLGGRVGLGGLLPPSRRAGVLNRRNSNERMPVFVVVLVVSLT